MLSLSHLCPGQSHFSNLIQLVILLGLIKMALGELCVAREIHVEASSWAAGKIL